MPALVIGLGEVLWDMLPNAKQLGGAPANFAYHCQALGLDSIQSQVISAIGQDTAGFEIIQKLEHLNINCDLLHTVKHHKTGSVSVILDSLGQPSYTIKQNVAWDFIPTISIKSPQTVDIVSFGSLAQRSVISQQSIHGFLNTLPNKTLKIFDINLRQTFYTQEIIESSLKLANIFKINSDELAVISNLLNIHGNEQDIITKISDIFQLRLCILTKGSNGSLLYFKNKFHYHSGIKTDSKDTVGAGDAFTAAIAIGLLKSFDITYLHDCANQIAAYVCSCSGATPKLPTNLIALFNK